MSHKYEAIAAVIDLEGGYVNHPDDPGGKTNHGITQRTARAHGYKGDMRDLTMDEAVHIIDVGYFQPLMIGVMINGVLPMTGEKLLDVGVNAGVYRASKFLQVALNAFRPKSSSAIAEDGAIGSGTLRALRDYAQRRGKGGDPVLRKAVNSLQGAHYISLGNSKKKFRSFTYGWLRARVDG